MILFLEKLMNSIFTSDSYILFVGIITAISFFVVQRLTGEVEKEVSECRKDSNKKLAEYIYRRLNTAYNFFTTMITIFPLLGMLGTVKSLIELNFAKEEIAELQAHFFDALTSTAWGIVFSIIFKILNAFIEYRVISQIESAGKFLKEEPLQIEKDGECSDEE